MKKFLNRQQKETLWDILLVTPQFILYFTLTILPFFVALPIIFSDRVSFLDLNVHFIGFKNFISIFKYPLAADFVPSVRRTASFTLLNYGMVYLFGLPLALFMYELKNKFKRIKGGFMTIIFLPWMISGLGSGMLLVLLFARNTGSFNLLFQKLGIISEAIDIKTSLAVTIFLPLIVGWRAAGFNMALFLSGLLTIPTSTTDAAAIDGTNYWQRLWYIYFPQMIPSIVIATIFCLIGSFGIFDELAGMGALYGNESAKFLSVVLYKLGFGTSSGTIGTLAEGVTMSIVVYMPLMIIAIFLNAIQKKLQY